MDLRYSGFARVPTIDSLSRASPREAQCWGAIIIQEVKIGIQSEEPSQCGSASDVLGKCTDP